MEDAEDSQQEKSFIKFKEPNPYDHKLTGHSSQIIKIYTPKGPDSQIFYTICREGQLRGWSMETQEMILKINLSKEQQHTKSFNQCLNIEDKDKWDYVPPSNDHLLGKQKKKDYTFNIEHLKKQSKGQTEGFDIQSVAFSDQYVFGSYLGGIVCKWSLNTGFLMGYINHSPVKINVMETQNKHQNLVTGSEDFCLRVIDIERNQAEKGIKLDGPISLLQIEHNYAHIISDINSYHKINIEKGQKVESIKLDGIINSFLVVDSLLIYNVQQDYCIDAKIYIYNFDNIPEIVDPTDDTPVEQQEFKPEIILQSPYIYQFAVYEDTLIAACDDNSIQFWDLKSYKYLDKLQHHKDTLTQVALVGGEENLFIVSSCSDHTILLNNFNQAIQMFKERRIMQFEHIWSAKFNAWYDTLNKKKKKGKGKGKGKKK